MREFYNSLRQQVYKMELKYLKESAADPERIKAAEERIKNAEKKD